MYGTHAEDISPGQGMVDQALSRLSSSMSGGMGDTTDPTQLLASLSGPPPWMIVAGIAGLSLAVLGVIWLSERKIEGR